MTRKVSRDSSLSIVSALIVILILAVALAAGAQMTGVGQQYTNHVVVSAQQDASARTQVRQHPPLPGITNADRNATFRSQRNRLGTNPMASNPPLFLPAVAYDSGGSASDSVALGDVNGDGRPDLLVANQCFKSGNCQHGSVGVLLGNGDGTLQPAITYGSGGRYAASIAVGDVNGDGKLDLVVANSCASVDDCSNGVVGVLSGNGDGTFGALWTYSSGGWYAASVAVEDVNGDGKPDLLVANTCPMKNTCSIGGSVSVLLNDGYGAFQPARAYDSGGFDARSVALGDVNGDGRPDLLVANQCVYRGSCPHGTVGVLLGNGDGTFQSALAYGSGGSIVHSVAVGDVNGDGKPDLLVVNECVSSSNCLNGTVGVLLGNGDGAFLPVVTYDSGGLYGRSVAVGDVNGDGTPDLLVANQIGANGEDRAVGVLLGNGDGTFQTAVTFGSGGQWPISVAVGDLNGDGKPDLALANVSGVGVLLNNSEPNNPTTTTLVSSLNPAPMRTPVIYTATVTSQDGGAVTGSVMFQDGVSTIATVSLADNQAAYTTTYTKGGNHKITATYSGDVHNLGSKSSILMEHITGFASKTVLITSGSPSFVGQAVTFTATVTSTQGAIPDGELVTFYDGTTTLGSVALASGMAPFPTSALSGKTHTIKATYKGDATYQASTGAVTQAVNKYSTTTTLRSSPNPTAYGEVVTFTATVTPAGPYPLTGNVKFWDGTTGIGTVVLSGGTASLTKSKLAVGTHAITAQYLGDAASVKSTSSVLDQVVQ